MEGKMNRTNRIIIVAIIILLLVLIGYQLRLKSSRESGDENHSQQDSLLFGLATGYGGLGDKAFNDMQFKGMLLAKKNHQINFIYEAPDENKDDASVIESLIAKKANIIIAGGGFHMVDPVDSLALKYPQVKFIIIDDQAKHYYPNVASIQFKQNEGSFLIGALCAMESKTKKVAMLGADNITIINDFYEGFKSGVAYIDPEIKPIIRYISDTDKTNSPFANPQVAHKIADQLYQSENVDIIYQVAAGSGMGVFNSAKQNKKFAIGVDSDQDYLAEGYILTSMMKNLDIAIDMIVGKILSEGFSNTPYKLGLKEKGVGLSDMSFTKENVNPDTIQRLKQIETDIIQGILIVPTLIP